jgi:hypothetical protein
VHTPKARYTQSNRKARPDKLPCQAVSIITDLFSHARPRSILPCKAQIIALPCKAQIIAQIYSPMQGCTDNLPYLITEIPPCKAVSAHVRRVHIMLMHGYPSTDNDQAGSRCLSTAHAVRSRCLSTHLMQLGAGV